MLQRLPELAVIKGLKECPQRKIDDGVRTAERNLRAILTYIRKNSYAEIFVTLYYIPDEGQPRVRSSVGALNVGIARAAAGIEDTYVVDLRESFAGHSCSALLSSWVQERDCLHPRPHGSREIAAAIQNVAAPLLYADGFDLRAEPATVLAPLCAAKRAVVIRTFGWGDEDRLEFLVDGKTVRARSA
ncbi:MAG: hypothetical protein ABR521_12715 [Gaiellaceae bacterium]